MESLPTAGIGNASRLAVQIRPSADVQLAASPPIPPIATRPAAPTAIVRGFQWAPLLFCRCQTLPSVESRKTAKPAAASPTATKRVPVQTTSWNCTPPIAGWRGPSIQRAGNGTALGAGGRIGVDDGRTVRPAADAVDGPGLGAAADRVADTAVGVEGGLAAHPPTSSVARIVIAIRRFAAARAIESPSRLM